MKKKTMLILLSACMALSMAACGKGEEGTEKTEEVTETVKGARTALPAVASVDMGIDPEEQVTSLCDYSAVPLTIEGNYDLTQDAIDEIIISDLTNYGLGCVEVTDREIVEEGDFVKVDFTGYLDGEAFEGGSATDEMISVSEDSGYIDGFVDGLVGAKVGETISQQVTFPDSYPSNPDLAGKETTFEFQIHGIYRAGTMEEVKEIVSDEEVNEIYGDYGITALQDLIDYETEYMTSLVENYKSNAITTALLEYMLENCTVEVPEDYLEARVTEYIVSFEESYLSEEEDLETYLSETLSVTLEEAMETWNQQIEEQIKYELIFGAIAAREGIELSEEEFTSAISGYLTSSSYGFTDETDVYEYYGAGSAENGEKYLRNQFLLNKAVESVAENAVVTIVPVEDEDSAAE